MKHIKPKIRDHFDEPRSYKTMNTLPSMVQPEHAEDQDINNIMARYTQTGYFPKNEIAQRFEDLTDIADFATLQDKVLQARSMFIQLPIDVKDTFRTAEAFLEAFGTAKGQKQLIDLGILTVKDSDKKEQALKKPVSESEGNPQEGSKKTPAS